MHSQSEVSPDESIDKNIFKYTDQFYYYYYYQYHYHQQLIMSRAQNSNIDLKLLGFLF